MACHRARIRATRWLHPSYEAARPHHLHAWRAGFPPL